MRSRKGFSPPKRRTVHPLMAALFLACLAIVLVVAGWLLHRERTPIGDRIYSTEHDQRITIRVEEGEDADTVGRILEQNALIAKHGDLARVIEQEGFETYIVPGEYRLSAAMPLKRIAYLLTRPHSAERTLIIYPGTTLHDMATLFAANDICKEKTFWKVVKNGGFEGFDFLPRRGERLRLEGFLFPGSYDYEDNMDPELILSMMLDRFDAAYKKVPKKTNGLTDYETVILASMLEREARTAGEKPTIASVYMNRLHADMPLQCDATILYAMPNHVGNLTFADYEHESPYNTYLHKGLPPTPIGNVNLPSLIAAADPAKTDYYFYLYNTQSRNAHVFAKTYEEHLHNRKVYGYDG